MLFHQNFLCEYSTFNFYLVTFVFYFSGGYKVPAGATCHIHIFHLHRQEDLFDNALKFDPDRFLPENSVGRHNYAYIPFSAGPRNCIGI